MRYSLFLSTLSLRRATWPGLLARPFFIISIHALLAESDPTNTRPYSSFLPFLSTLSLRRATLRRRVENVHKAFLSTLSLRRATRAVAHVALCGYISIHALLAESDGRRLVQLQRGAISIHALLAESDLTFAVAFGTHEIFLSTLSLRRATCI